MATTLDLTKVPIKVIELFIIFNVGTFSEARLDLHPPGYPLHPGGGGPPHPGFSPMAAAQFMMSHPAAQVATSYSSSPLVVLSLVVLSLVVLSLVVLSSVSGDSFSNSLKFRPIYQVMIFVTIRVHQQKLR